jgi:hypothetical protein
MRDLRSALLRRWRGKTVFVRFEFRGEFNAYGPRYEL